MIGSPERRGRGGWMLKGSREKKEGRKGRREQSMLGNDEEGRKEGRCEKIMGRQNVAHGREREERGTGKRTLGTEEKVNIKKSMKRR